VIDVEATLAEDVPATLMVVDMLGCVLYADQATANERRAGSMSRQLDVQDAAAGAYVVRVVTPTEGCTMLVSKQ
jgi:hypothetical protein